MSQCLADGQSIIITCNDPANIKSIQASETLVTLRTPQDLDVYRNLLAASPTSLPQQFLQGQLKMSMNEVNLNMDGQAIRPIRNGAMPDAAQDTAGC